MMFIKLSRSVMTKCNVHYKKGPDCVFRLVVHEKSVYNLWILVTYYSAEMTKCIQNNKSLGSKTSNTIS